MTKREITFFVVNCVLLVIGVFIVLYKSDLIGGAIMGFAGANFVWHMILTD